MKKSVLIVAMAAMLAVPVFQASAVKESVTALAAEGTSTKQSVKKYHVTSDVLNVRSGPGTHYPVIGSLTHGMEPESVNPNGESTSKVQ